jgi:hypothetical protein
MLRVGNLMIRVQLLPLEKCDIKSQQSWGKLLRRLWTQISERQKGKISSSVNRKGGKKVIVTAK